MATGTKRANNKGIATGLWIDQEVLARHLQSRVQRSSSPDDEHSELNNRILKLADIVLDAQRRFDRE
jgi:hypothetical protein